MNENSYYTLRKQPWVCYYEPEELDLGQYIFCTRCEDYVYAYCSIHGPLLVVPDDKVPEGVTSIPKAVLTIPSAFLHIAPSTIPGAGLGVFSTMTLPVDVRFGPFKGKITEKVNSDYCWQISQNRTLDAADASASNWLRYVNCSRSFGEQNLVAFLYRERIYYRTIKIVPRGTELLVFYGSKFAEKLGIDLRHYHSKPAPVLGILPTYKEPQINFEEISKELVPYPIPGFTDIEEISQQNTFTDKEKIPNEDFSLINNCNDQIQDKSQSMDSEFHTESNDTQYEHINDMRVDLKQKKSSLKCGECDYKSASVEVLEKHSQLHNPSRPYVCTVCNYRFATRVKLQGHSTIHGDHKCNICEDNFSSAKEMLRHKATHTKIYKCTICDFETRRSTSLTNHIKSMFTHGDFKCQLCDFTTNGRQQYFAHTKTHNGAHECNLCSYRTPNGMSMATHMEAHEKRYECNKCDDKFSYPYHLKRHLFYRHGVKM